jgi:hypothetical protein
LEHDIASALLALLVAFLTPEKHDAVQSLLGKNHGRHQGSPGQAVQTSIPLLN